MQHRSKSPKARIAKGRIVGDKKSENVKNNAGSESFSFSPEKEKSALSLADILTSVSKLNHNQSKPTGKTLTSLYYRAKDIASKKEQKSQAIFKELHPFKPKLNKLSEKMIKTAKKEGIDLRHSKKAKNYQPQPSPIEDPKEVKHISMTQFIDKYNSQIMRYRQKPKGEPFIDTLDKIDNNCTFSPQLDRKSMEIAKKNQIDLYSKTVRDYRLKTEKIEKILTVQEMEELSKCTFSPRIIRNYSRASRPSLELKEKNYSRGYSRNSRSANRSFYNISYVEE